LKKPSYLALASVVTVLLSILYYYLSIRAAGMEPSSFFNFSQFTTPAFVIKNWGIGYFTGTVVMNIVTAAMTGILIAVSVANYRANKLAGTAAAGSVSSAAIALATFTCPGCALPVTATLGVAVMGTTLPVFGLEFQFVTFFILLGTMVWLARRMRFPQHTTPTSDTLELVAPAKQ
jgi:hypothetical protein